MLVTLGGGGQFSEQTARMFVVLVLVVKFEFFRRIEALAFAEEVGWHISCLEQILALFSLLISRF